MYIIYQIQYIGLKIAVVAPNQVEYIDSILTDQYKLQFVHKIFSIHYTRVTSRSTNIGYNSKKLLL